MTVTLLLVLCYLVSRADAHVWQTSTRAPADAQTRHTPRHSPGYQLAAKLNRALARTPMRGTGFALVVEGRRYNVHPAFIAAVAGFEGDYGRQACLPYNPYGISSCGRAWRAPVFRSWRESIRYAARFLASHWPHARTPWDYVGYCTCGARAWGTAVAGKMRELGFPPVTRWRP